MPGVTAWIGWLALAYAIVSRLGYVGWVGAALRREERSRAFTGGVGRAAGFARFRRGASAVMTNDGVAFVAACVAGWGTLPALLPRAATVVTGVLLVLLGVGTKLWARSILGGDAYYWANFFLEAPEVVPARRGPYRYLRNPMYTVGYAHTYGLALVTASVPGLVAAVFDQVAVLVFYRLVEKPHFDRHSAAARALGGNRARVE